MEHTETLGICIGSSTVSAVFLRRNFNSTEVESIEVIPHNGHPKKVLETILSRKTPERITVTGKKLRNLLNLPSISEAEAIELAVEYLRLKPDLVISAGGENLIVYQLGKDCKISKVFTGNKCASGTGEFFLQQIKRMNLDFEEAISLGLTGVPYHISGRCSVFCKSDCTHALNKGIPKENVVAGLSRMIAQKIIELTSKVPRRNAILIGGLSQNLAMLRFLENHFDNLIIPKEALYFEALGSALHAQKNGKYKVSRNYFFKENKSSFSFLKPLKDFISYVEFKDIKRGSLNPYDECIIGLDVGSTTTKAVLLRINDDSILASKYLRTNGDPINASIECYKSLKEQIKLPVQIVGIGVTGSGRHIAGLHAGTKGIINEIIAHATAAVHFDKDVDTIFEIGGQDAKYTFITAGVASDYAMNEACSAGTGSFLEEAAKTSLNTDYTEIGELALLADNPPNFNDQCAAFIGSDIKNALNEGITKENILAGLVYSVCMNYNNRVKGNRQVGKKVFMQGGVCYNRAVPVAMAALTGKNIIVPPEPGLMGAFGVALEIKKRLQIGLIEKKNFDLDELINRKVIYEKSFICAGGKENCDRKCEISLFKIDGKKIPFGGACNKYYNLVLDINTNALGKDLIQYRQYLVFEKYIDKNINDINCNSPSIGISKSFLTNTLYPLYYNFFSKLGCRVILGDEVKIAGVEKRESSFCYPVELAHGFFQDLIDKKPDYIFLPQVNGNFTKDNQQYKKTCVFVQAENYYLKTTFQDSLKGIKLISPVFDFSNGYENEEEKFIQIGKELGFTRKKSSEAYNYALQKLNEMFQEFKDAGRKYLEELQNHPDKIAIVLFGRSYNSFAAEANLGIPRKFSSRNVDIIPYDFLPGDEYDSFNHMYWAAGQQILKAARFVKNHNQLFGVFITNYSCGPDSFILTYFRNIMGKKPSLTLELDSHSADAGINTRIDAAIEIFRSYRTLSEKGIITESYSTFRPLKVLSPNHIIDSDGKVISLTDPQVRLLIPSMGKLGTEAFASACRYFGINSEPLPVYDYETLITGRGNTTCKECLPLILIAGSIKNYYQKKNPNEKTIVFLPKSAGPCRFGQYSVFIEELINKNRMENIGILSLIDEDGYEGFDSKFTLRAWVAITISDVMKNIYNAIQALAVDKNYASSVFNSGFQKILRNLESSELEEVYQILDEVAIELSMIKTKIPFNQSKKIALVGEIFVRHDEFSRIDLLDKLIDNEFVVKVVPIGEYIYYSNFLANKNLRNSFNLKQWIYLKLKNRKQKETESKIKKILMKSGFCDYDLISIDKVIESANPFIQPELEGEAILTVGYSLKHILQDVCGIISIGPFGCMPSRVAESILNIEMNIDGKLKSQNGFNKLFNSEIHELPFLSVETDGNLFPPIIQSKLEIFMLQAERMHKKMMNIKDYKREGI